MKSTYLAIAFIIVNVMLVISCSKQSSETTIFGETTILDKTDSALVVIKSAAPEIESIESGDEKNTILNGAEHRQLGAHVHGAASMNLTLDKNQLDITMSIPGMDAVGFEHAAVTDEDQDTLQKALAYLQKPNTIFVAPADAGCVLTKGELTTALLNTAAKINSHADVDISYQWQCKNTSALKTLSVKLFSHFQHLQKIKVSWIAFDKQGATDLTPTDTLVVLE